MRHAPASAPEGTRSDADLLEGLLQMAVEGHTEDRQFQQIGDEVYTRLLDTYRVDSLSR